MLKYGLSEKQLQEIQGIIASYDAVEEAILFGSRAIDTYKEASDIDIAIKGEKADWSLAMTIKDHFEEETYLPFFFDVIAYNSIQSDELRQHIDRKGKALFSRRMSEWREVRLDNVLEVKYGKDHKNLQDGLVPCFGTGGIMRYVNDELYNKESILIPRKGSLNNIYYLDKPFWTVDTLFWTKIKKELVVAKFLFYQLTLIDFTILNVGSAVPSLTVPVLNEVDILLPPLPEQKAIAEVLSSLDDKIDLLHRQNKTLEQMAETLFRQWFVEEAGEDWEEGVLPEEFDFTMGQSPPGSSFNEAGIGIPMFQGNADFGFRFPTERVFTTEQKRLAKPFDTLISVRAPVGAQNMAEQECCIGRGVAAFRYKYNHEFYTYTYFKLESLMEEIKKFNDEGTVFGSISKGDFQKMEVVIPPEDLVSKFESEVKPINDKVIKNCRQIRTLESLRDTLLPKLMSGELSVDFDKLRDNNYE